MTIKNLFWNIFIVLIVSQSSYAQEITKVGTTAGKFLSIPAGARGMALGGAVVANVDDPSAMYWNPAGITRIESPEFAFDYIQWFEDLNHEFIGVVFPMGSNGTIGLNVVSFGVDDMEVTTETAQEGTGELFGASSYAIGLAYARALTTDFSIGVNTKYIREQIFNSSASALALDIGVTYNTPFNNTILGFSISNFGQKLQMTGEDLFVKVDIDNSQSGNNENLTATLNTDKFDLPLLMRIGIANNIINTEQMRFTLAIDGLHPNDNTESVNVGGELAFLNETIFLRGGLNSLALEERQSEFSLGAGLNYPISGQTNIDLEYVYQSHKYLGSVQMYSIGITL